MELFGLAAGDWAEWAAAIAGFLAFGAVIVGLWLQDKWRRDDINRLREERRDDELSLQARQVGGFIRWAGDPFERKGLRLRPLELTVRNSSPLDVRAVQGLLSEVHGFEPIVARFEALPVASPGETTATLDVLAGRDYLLQLEFDDDNGTRWLKYGPGGGLERLSSE